MRSPPAPRSSSGGTSTTRPRSGATSTSPAPPSPRTAAPASASPCCPRPSAAWSDPTMYYADTSSSWTLPGTWASVLADETQKPYFRDLVTFVTQERENETVYPPEDDVFKAFELTPFEQVRVVILG